MLNRELITWFLLRRPAAPEPRTASWTILALAGIGAALVWSAVIYLELRVNAAFVLLAAIVLLTLGVPARAAHGPAPVPSGGGGAGR